MATDVTRKTTREIAARALCKFDGHKEDAESEGKPMWESYLPKADAVLVAIGVHLPKSYI